jgi:signal transduction histidine kinase
MKIKLFAILAIGALVITVATAIGVANIQTLDRTVFIRENVRNEAALIKQSASFLTESYAERLVQIVSEVELTAPFSESAIFSSSDYNMVSAMVPAKDAGWKIVWSQRRGKRNIGWPKSEEAEMVKALPLAAVNQQRSIWFRHLSDSGHALYVLLVSVQLPQSLKTSADPNAKQMIVAGVLSNQAFAGAIESFKGTDREAVILDDRGYALGYTRQQYVGAPLTNHAMVLKLVKERNQEDYGEFKNAQGRKIIGAYARLSRTNLYAMVTRPIEGLPSLVKITYTSLAAYGLGGLLVCMLFGLLLFRSQITSFEYLQDFTISLAQGLPIRAPESYANMPQVLRESILKIRDGEAPSIKIAVEPPEEDELVSEASSDEVTQPEAELPQPATGQELVAEPRAEIVEQKAKQEYEKAIRGLIHNFKNPLGAILGQAQLARSKKDGEEPKEHYAVIEREARRLREALNELQQTVEGSELMSSARRVNLTELLLGLLVEMRPQFEEWNIKLRKDLKPATEVTGDEIHLKAVFR